VFYLFAVAASGQWMHWTGLGFVCVTLQIVGSIPLTEKLSVAKYPDYRAYQVSTPVLVPFLRSRAKGR
jgi:steroid 5-alpha reductase family enzyme